MSFVWVTLIWTACSNIPNWLFAVKYWSISIQVPKLLTPGENLKKWVLYLEKAVFYFLITFTGLCGPVIIALVYGKFFAHEDHGEKYNKSIVYLLKLYVVLPSVIGLFCLLDAYRRLSQVQNVPLTINKWKMALHILASILNTGQALLLFYYLQPGISIADY